MGLICKVCKDVAAVVIVSDCSISSLTYARLIMSVLPAYENYLKWYNLLYSYVLHLFTHTAAVTTALDTSPG